MTSRGDWLIIVCFLSMLSQNPLDYLVFCFGLALRSLERGFVEFLNYIIMQISIIILSLSTKFKIPHKIKYLSFFNIKLSEK